MAEGIKWFEGFEVDNALSVWEDNFGIARSATYARSGGYGMAPVGSLGTGYGQSPLWNPTTEIIVGFAFKPVAYDLGSLPNELYLCQLIQPPGSGTGLLNFTQQKTFGILNGANSVIGYTTRYLELDAWYYIEWYYKVHPTGGASILRINGEVAFSVSGINTGTPAFGGINQIYLGRIGGGSSGTNLWYDDIYIRDALVVNEFLGDVEVIGIELEDDYITQFVRNTGPKNYLTQIENTPDEDVTYVSSDVAAKDLYEVDDSTYTGVIHAVQLVSRGKKTSTELWRLHNIVHVGGLELNGPDRYMSYPLYETYPPDVFGHQPNGSDWTIGAFNAMKVGFYAESV